MSNDLETRLSNAFTSLVESVVEDEDEYESLPTSNIYAHLAAGALAGTAEHCFMYPVDVVKVSSSNLSLNNRKRKRKRIRIKKKKKSNPCSFSDFSLSLFF